MKSLALIHFDIQLKGLLINRNVVDTCDVKPSRLTSSSHSCSARKVRTTFVTARCGGGRLNAIGHLAIV